MDEEVQPLFAVSVQVVDDRLHQVQFTVVLQIEVEVVLGDDVVVERLDANGLILTHA